MRRMRLDDDGTSGGERGDGVATGYREREREVARREVGDRTDRNEHAAQIAARRDGIGVGRVDDRFEVRTVGDGSGEGAHLRARPGPLAGQPGRPERGLRVGHVGRRRLQVLAQQRPGPGVARLERRHA
jgi:hypothetical protein